MYQQSVISELPGQALSTWDLFQIHCNPIWLSSTWTKSAYFEMMAYGLLVWKNFVLTPVVNQLYIVLF